MNEKETAAYTECGGFFVRNITFHPEMLNLNVCI